MRTSLIICLLTALRVAFVGDPQVDNEKELDYARRSIYAELRQRSDIDLVIVLGDLVNENPALVAPSEAILDSLGRPWVRVNGNHDGPVSPRDTVISRGNVHFILMDNVRRTRKGYEGGLRKSQKEWLQAVVDAIPRDERLVLCTHIPLSQTRGRDSLSNIISAHSQVLAVCGHTHYAERHLLERGVEEVVAGAACGSWWRGVKDDAGVPYALMNCGAPRGWYIADFKTSGHSRKWYGLQYKAVGRPDVCSAHVRDGRLVVNVYGGSREGSVQVRLNGRWMPLRHSYELAPEVADLIGFNHAQTREYRKAHRDEFIPARRLPSPHIWAENVSALAPGDKVKIRYADPSMSFNTSVEIKN